jgi:hypothetical protein
MSIIMKDQSKNSPNINVRFDKKVQTVSLVDKWTSEHIRMYNGDHERVLWIGCAFLLLTRQKQTSLPLLSLAASVATLRFAAFAMT